MFGLTSFRTQLLLLIIGLFSLVLTSVFIAVNHANQTNARAHLEETLSITAFAFQRDLTSRNNVLTEKARLLSADFAFKEAVVTKDHETILSALENHRMRVGANVMMLATMEGEIIADTLHKDKQNEQWSLQALQASAESTNTGEANGIQLIDGKPYQLVLTPLFTPEPSAWIVIGFLIDERFSKQLAEQTHSQVSLLYSHESTTTVDADWLTLSSTLSSSEQNDLLDYLKNRKTTSVFLNPVEDIQLNNHAFLSRVLNIQGAAEGRTVAVLQRSLSKVLEPFMRLRNIMFALFGLGLLFAIISVFYIARSLSRPLESLTETVKLIDKGDYQQVDIIPRKDEIGTLSTAVNRMSLGLKERDQVRDLLGKVVSPEIAAELLSKDIDLGGEDRDATILFSDIRQFTSFCEKRDPKDILQLLNRYLGCMTQAVEDHNGVIDKYIGDAIMALFGVPVDIKNAPEQSVKSALAMMQALESLNNDLIAEKRSPIRIGIGINTGNVVAGNMGSVNRLNYTVIGDCVNLASRLEGLTKYFGVSIIVSESTAKSCENIHFRQLGNVRVKGKEEGVGIFEPLLIKTLSAQQKQWLDLQQQAIHYFQQRSWEKSQGAFQSLLESNPNQQLVYQIYLENISAYLHQEPDDNWVGELVFNKK